jgi:hypothetical protein
VPTLGANMFVFGVFVTFGVFAKSFVFGAFGGLNFLIVVTKAIKMGEKVKNTNLFQKNSQHA